MPALAFGHLVLAATMIALPAGHYRPLYGAGAATVAVHAFRLDRDPVTRADFLAFVRAHPEWRRSTVSTERAERAGYLADWRGDLDAGGAADLRRPVTGVSRLAARAYCAARGARLPSVAEWEYAAAASAARRDASGDPAFVRQLLATYSTRPRPLPPVERGAVNAWGVRGLHDLAWEWTDDTATAHADAAHAGHAHPGSAHTVGCASAALGAADPTNYPAFLRNAIRAGVTDRSTLETLGFRCAQ